MRLPPPMAHSLSFMMPVSVSGGILPGMSREQRDRAQAFINSNCHTPNNICSKFSDTCDELADKYAWNDSCLRARLDVQQYYAERGIPDNGNHGLAIQMTAGRKQSCRDIWNRYCR